MRECIGDVAIRRQLGDIRRESSNWTWRSPTGNRTRLLRRLLASAAATALTALSAGSASAQTWQGNTNSDWTNGTNWSSGLAPTGLTTVTIDSSSPNPTVLGVNGPATGATRTMTVGLNGTSANLRIQNGSTLTSAGPIFAIGSVGGSAGTVTVTGVGSQWILSGAALRVGNSGAGTLNIGNGARVNAQAGLSVGNLSTGSGTLNISGGGTLETSFLRRGAGAAQANFDIGVLKATANNVTFIGGFSGTNLNILAGGLTVDTASFTVGTDAASAFTGTGGLTVAGGGVFNALANNAYLGETRIGTGSTLSLQGVGAVASSSRVVADGTFDISAVTPTGASIQSLAGAGTVALGAKTLTLTNANDTFAGAIAGTGGLILSAGTQTLTGISNYTGATNVTGTGTLQLLNGGQITSTSSTVLNGPGASATVSGTGSLLQTGTLTLGGSAGAATTLNVVNGGVVRTTVNAITQIGTNVPQTAIVNVDGQGSLLDTAGALGVGSGGAPTTSYLNVTNGGSVRSNGGFVGSANNSANTKSALISGTGSNWTVNGNLQIQAGSMSVLGGGAVAATSSTIGIFGTVSDLLVSGAGSTYSVTNNLVFGSSSGKGFVTLADGARITLGGQLTLTSTATATGVLNIGGAEGQAATGAGMLDAATLVFGPGTGRVNFNHTDFELCVRRRNVRRWRCEPNGARHHRAHRRQHLFGPHHHFGRHAARWRRQCAEPELGVLRALGRHARSRRVRPHADDAEQRRHCCAEWRTGDDAHHRQ